MDWLRILAYRKTFITKTIKVSWIVKALSRSEKWFQDISDVFEVLLTIEIHSLHSSPHAAGLRQLTVKQNIFQKNNSSLERSNRWLMAWKRERHKRQEKCWTLIFHKNLNKHAFACAHYKWDVFTTMNFQFYWEWSIPYWNGQTKSWKKSLFSYIFR